MNEKYTSARILDPHDSLYAVGLRLIWPHLHLSNRPRTMPSVGATADVQNGIGKLTTALKLRPNNSRNWSTLWLLGKAHEALGHFEDSYQCFNAAFKINPTHVDVARELMASCLRIGNMREALCAAMAARDLAPSNPGVIANLALALFRNDRLDEALSTACEAHKLAPLDSITRSLIEEIERKIQTGLRHV